MYAVTTWYEHCTCNGQTHVHQMFVLLLHTARESKQQVTENFRAPGFMVHVGYSDTLLIPFWPTIC
jgi:hypothetical protein